MNFFLETLRLGLANLRLHKLRSLLTALGIIIGVAAVVAIASYGEGAKRAALADILDLGASNIIVRSVKPLEPQDENQTNSRSTRYGLTNRDLTRLSETVGPIDGIVPLKRVGDQVIRGTVTVGSAAVMGTTPELSEVLNLHVARGRYLENEDVRPPANVAVLGAEVAARLFPLSDPVGNTFRIDGKTFRVAGVMRRVGLAGGAGSALVGRDLNFDVHIPIETARSRFGDIRMARGAGSFSREEVEITELILRTPDEDAVLTVADQVERVLALEHAETGDVTTVVPLELIQQAERVEFRSNMLMVIIGGLSLRDSVFAGEEVQLIATLGNYTYEWSPTNSLNNSTIFNPIATPILPTAYVVKVTDENGCVNLDTIFIRIRQFQCAEPNIFIPNAFTPNNDGHNDMLRVRANSLSEFYFAVYNRFGEKVFESNNPDDGWDGTFKGAVLAPEVFGYYIEIKCLGG
ncbi:MAG: ABC transporter permease, partial [Planctomycetota bacterium]